MRVTYENFRSAFTQAGYSLSETAHLFRALKSMDRESRKWFIHWFFTGELPNNEIEGITAEYLINELQCKPLNAFIILDWLKSEPETAKYFVMKIPVLFNSEETLQLKTISAGDENGLDEITDEFSE